VDTNNRGRLLRDGLARDEVVGRPTFFSLGDYHLAVCGRGCVTGKKGKLFPPLALPRLSRCVRRNRQCLNARAPFLGCPAPPRKFHRRPNRSWFFTAVYRPSLSWGAGSSCHPPPQSAIAVVLLVGAGLASGLGSESLPGRSMRATFMSCPIAGCELAWAETHMRRGQDKVLESFPEGAYVAAKDSACGDFDRSQVEHDGDVVHLTRAISGDRA